MKFFAIFILNFFAFYFFSAFVSPPEIRDCNGMNDSTYYQRKEKLIMYERSFTPSYYDTEVYLFKKSDSAKTAGSSLEQFNSAPPETLQGFRVQLLSTSVFDDAAAFRNSLNSAFPELWVYTIYEAPSYKIRIGDFTNRADANAFASELSKKGFKDGWVVPDRIIKNQPPKPPLPTTIDSVSTVRY